MCTLPLSDERSNLAVLRLLSNDTVSWDRRHVVQSWVCVVLFYRRAAELWPVVECVFSSKHLLLSTLHYILSKRLSQKSIVRFFYLDVEINWQRDNPQRNSSGWSIFNHFLAILNLKKTKRAVSDQCLPDFHSILSRKKYPVRSSLILCSCSVFLVPSFLFPSLTIRLLKLTRKLAINGSMMVSECSNVAV